MYPGIHSRKQTNRTNESILEEFFGGSPRRSNISHGLESMPRFERDSNDVNGNQMGAVLSPGPVSHDYPGFRPHSCTLSP